MEIRFECECYERTLVIEIPNRYSRSKEKMLENLDEYYVEWTFGETEETEVMCLEEYMMYRLTEQYDREFEWHVEEG